jgi:hypothetical protein
VLVNDEPILCTSARHVEKLLRLRPGQAVAGRGAEDDSVGPSEIVVGRLLNVLRLQARAAHPSFEVIASLGESSRTLRKRTSAPHPSAPFLTARAN